MFISYQILIENATEKSYRNFYLFKSNKLTEYLTSYVPSNNVLGIGNRAVKTVWSVLP